MGFEPARAEYTSTGRVQKKNCSVWGSNLRVQKILRAGVEPTQPAGNINILYKNCAQTLIGALFEL